MKEENLNKYSFGKKKLGNDKYFVAYSIKAFFKFHNITGTYSKHSKTNIQCRYLLWNIQLQKKQKIYKHKNWKQYVRLERDIGVIYINLLKNHLLLV